MSAPPELLLALLEASAAAWVVVLSVVPLGNAVCEVLRGRGGKCACLSVCNRWEAFSVEFVRSLMVVVQVQLPEAYSTKFRSRIEKTHFY